MGDPLQIDPMSAASPDLDAVRMEELRKSIAEIGQLVPIVCYQGRIIDGRKRHAVCVALGIEPQVSVVPDGTDPGTHAHALNILRTHYSVSQRAQYAAKLANLARGQKKTGNVGIPTSARVTVPEAARRLGVNRALVEDAKRVQRDGIPEVAAAVEAGRLSTYAAREISKSPKPEQADLLARALAAKGDRKKMKAGTLRSRKGYRKKPVGRVLPRALAQLGNHADILEEYVSGDLPRNGARGEWLRQLESIITLLRRIARRLKEGSDGTEGGSHVSRKDRVGAGTKDRDEGTGPASV